MSATVRVVLHGDLKQFGGPFDWGVKTPKEAVRALCIMRPGFQAHLAGGEYRLIRGKTETGSDLGENMLGINLAAGSEFHIVPAAKGAGGGGGKAILGVVLVAAAFVTAGSSLTGLGAVAAGGAAATAATGSAFAGFAAGIALKVGVFLILDGVSQMLAPTKNGNSAANQQSFILSDPGNTVEQGVPVPLVYGQLRVGSVQVSVGYSTSEIAVGANAPNGSPYYVPNYSTGGSK
jgi:predicted phage tail protein